MRNRFSALNEVTDENQSRKAASFLKVNIIKKKNKPMFYTDSYGCNISTLLIKINVVSVYSKVRPTLHYIVRSTKVEDVLKNCERDCSSQVAIMGGANDIARNETKNCINTLKRTLATLTCMNVVVLNIPTRHDLIKESKVNKDIKKANMDIIIIALYRSPSGVPHRFFVHLIGILEQLV
jgi:hypothetical protein